MYDEGILLSFFQPELSQQVVDLNTQPYAHKPIFKPCQGALHSNHTASELIVSHLEITRCSFFIFFVSTVASGRHEERLNPAETGSERAGFLTVVSVMLKATSVQYKRGFVRCLKLLWISAQSRNNIRNQV